MLQMNIKTPRKCSECPCFSTSLYGHCKATDTWFSETNHALTAEERPKFCPIVVNEKISRWLGPGRIEQCDWACETCGFWAKRRYKYCPGCGCMMVNAEKKNGKG